MSFINQLSSTDSPSGGDLLPLYKSNQGDARKLSLSNLLAFMQDNLTFPSTGFVDFAIQRAAPSATGFSVAITDSSANTWLILTPTAGYASGTIVLPSVTSAIDKQEVLVNCTQQVTALTVDGNGAVAVTGEPAALGADDFFKLKYDAATQTWFRVG